MPKTAEACDFTLTAGNSALLVVDLQRGFCERPLAEKLGFSASQHYWDRVDGAVLPNAARLIDQARKAGVEVIYTVIEALTLDGRDRSLDHKRCDFLVPKGSEGGRVMPALAPQGDEILLPKSASGIFNATNIEYLLRNLGVERLAIFGVYTNQCVESAVRDAADRGFLVTLVADACATKTPEQEAASLAVMQGYARIAETAALLDEMRPRGASAA
ncbi:cysteine hydrolase [Pelagibius litoralis]|uniref:Cysteine hydrolase n=1 Tax=Pelagibius litoralis TaxID=374515 RepID=A0A967EXK9_9PROT|nr:isochorismatase family cysteine hydrolase [Pelagibius litoralis]NIA69278.1 cysteine hydrolase [Pelagibius litoralis]